MNNEMIILNSKLDKLILWYSYFILNNIDKYIVNQENRHLNDVSLPYLLFNSKLNHFLQSKIYIYSLKLIIVLNLLIL